MKKVPIINVHLRRVPVLYLLVSLLPLVSPARSLQAGVIPPDVVEKKQVQLAAEKGRVEGIASYYANRFNGRKTRSGERYDPEKLTAAHSDLPFGTKVKVVNLANGRDVIVTINDRCRRKSVPFIDLSRAAARKLGFLGQGTTRVTFSILADAPEP
jgi:peptidoglycan lytic transglycosylase